MNETPSSSSKLSSKLLIRSEVLAVIEFLSIVLSPSKQEKQKQIKRLSGIPDQEAVRDILLKELRRVKTGVKGSKGGNTLQSVTELLMELGTIATLQEPLWEIIRNADVPDEVKDAANLILRHLGDETDPDLYLDYLEDPQGLINRETQRMLEVASKNPEALIDFLDFIFSLPEQEQVNLLTSLEEEYSPEYLVNIYISVLLTYPAPALQELTLKWLGETRSAKAAYFLQHLLEVQDNLDEAAQKIAKRSLTELKLAGCMPAPEDAPHDITRHTQIFECYMTLSDGIGNQGIIVSRKNENGDISLMSVAINDLHGVIDCFGFYQLGESDYNRIMEKFHEESCKIPIPPQFCKQKLLSAEHISEREQHRIPYEFTCWKVIIEDITPENIDTVELCKSWANPDWKIGGANLYQHPDFSTWFLEEGDHPVVTEILSDVAGVLSRLPKAEDPEQLELFRTRMDQSAEILARALMTTEWCGILIQRLADAAYLLRCQETTTFSTLAATEAVKLLHLEKPESSETPIDGFLLQYGRRCVEEYLLRLKQKPDASLSVEEYVSYLLKIWEI